MTRPSPHWSRGSVTGFHVDIRPSRSLHILASTSLFLAALGLLILSAPHSLEFTVLLSGGVFVVTVRAFRTPVSDSRAAGVYSRAATLDGILWTTTRRDSGKTQRWYLLNSYSTPWLVVLYMRNESGWRRTSLALPRDALSADAHRCLRVMLTLMQESGG